MKNSKELRCLTAYCRISHLVLLLSTMCVNADTLIAPNDPGINCYGRFDMTDPAKPRCNWSGAIIEATFPGPTIGMRMDHPNAYYDVEIDGKPDTVIATGSGKDYLFRKNLTPQTHTVRILLRSEDHYSAGTFLGVYLANGKVLSAPPLKPDRKIEFIGDSYTAGYGIESPSRDCGGQLQKYTNANRAFAALVTRVFDAQSSILAWSGAGMVRNYGESSKRSSAPFPAHYDAVLGEVTGGGTWNFSKWIPGLVVICLGTNDYSTTPHPDDSMYVGDYHKLIARVLEHYPEASVLCVSTGEATFEKNVRRVVTEENTTFNHPKVYFAPYPPSLENTGCDWHPSIKDNVKVAAVLVDTIMKKLSWDTAAPLAASSHPAGVSRRSIVNLSGGMVNGRFEIVLDGKNGASVPLMLITMRGEVMARRLLKTGAPCSFSMDLYRPGVYLAGNPECGWVRAVMRR